MSGKYVITKSDFLGGWAVVSPIRTVNHGYGPIQSCEGETLATHAEAIEWAETHAILSFIEFYATHTAPEPVR